MRRVDVPAIPLTKEELPAALAAAGVRVNGHAERFFAHPRFAPEGFGGAQVVIASLRELGHPEAATLGEILALAPALGLKPCQSETGLFLRLAWTEQEPSRNEILSGQHRAPDGAVTVLSAPLEEDDAFPKGLYLRRVGDTLWLRGYVCGEDHLWSEDDLFAFEETRRKP